MKKINCWINMDCFEDLYVCEDFEFKILFISFLWNICFVYLFWIVFGGVFVYYRLNVYMV